MARNTAEEQEIQRLIRLAADSRIEIRGKVAHLRHQLDVPSRVRGSLGSHPSAWMFGSMATGLFASALFRRRPPKTKKKSKLAAALVGLTLTAVKPAARIWLADRAKLWLAGGPGPRPLPRDPT